MQPIHAILFEPVGCLAEFPAGPFIEIAARLFGRRQKPSRSGSRSYWHLLNLLEEGAAKPDPMVESLELEAVAASSLYEDVLPAAAELRTLGIRLCIATSLSNAAVTRFLEKSGAFEVFSSVSNRENSAGVKAAPLRHALAVASLDPRRTMFLTDTAEGLKVAKSVGVNSVLMMNDPDEAKRLAALGPDGGIVSLHELPDFIRLIASNSPRVSA